MGRPRGARAAAACPTSATTWCWARRWRASTSTGPGFTLQNDIIEPYLLRYATEEQKGRWLPGFCSGETITAIAMTEPGAGSDLQGVRTTAVRDGDSYVLNGSKTFITNGIHADLVIVVAKTDPSAGAHGTSLVVVERGMKGFERGRNLDKVGLSAQDTAELHFDDVRVPADNLLGAEGGGFVALMENLPQERLSIATTAAAGAEAAFARDAAVLQGPHRLRPSDRQLPGQPVHPRRDRHPARGDCARSSTGRSSPTWPAT